MGHSDETAGRAWATSWAASIGRNIFSVRKSRGIIAQQLADRCSELGYPLARSTIANIESGRKRDIPVQEIAVIARALGVPPVRLLYPIEDGGISFTALPDVEVLPTEAMEWFSGRARIDDDGAVSVLTNDGTDAGLSNARTERDNRLYALYVLGRLEDLRDRLREARAGVLPLGFPDSERMDHLGVTGPSDAEFFAEQTAAQIKQHERDLYHAVSTMQQARANLRAGGMVPPQLPEALRPPLEALGGDA